jgi:hypothetical protein
MGYPRVRVRQKAHQQYAYYSRTQLWATAKCTNCKIASRGSGLRCDDAVRPLSADTSAVVKLQTRLDVEAIAVTKGEVDEPAAVAHLVQLIPPARVDLVNDVMARIGRRKADRKDWPPFWLVCELASKVKRAHAGEVRLRGESGEVVDVLAYVDKMQQTRQVYRLTRHGVLIGEYKTVDELAKVVNLAELVEDDPGRAATPPAES